VELKTKLIAEANKQEIVILRKFEIPVELLFKAYTEPELVEQWMGNKVLKMDNIAHGSYKFESMDKLGNVVFRANGCIHKVIENECIIRTFEMETTGFPVQLEFLEFESTSEGTSQLTMKIIFKSIVDRDNMLKLPFAQGINWAHNQLEKLIGNFNN
jgi:uncharacterized protein YndB with AHSA1/START domain